MVDAVRRSAIERGITRMVGFLVAVGIGVLIGWIGGVLVSASVG